MRIYGCVVFCECKIYFVFLVQMIRMEFALFQHSRVANADIHDGSIFSEYCENKKESQPITVYTTHYSYEANWFHSGLWSCTEDSTWKQFGWW